MEIKVFGSNKEMLDFIRGKIKYIEPKKARKSKAKKDAVSAKQGN